MIEEQPEKSSGDILLEDQGKEILNNVLRSLEGAVDFWITFAPQKGGALTQSLAERFSGFLDSHINNLLNLQKDLNTYADRAQDGEAS